MNIKKIGMTALAASLVSVSAQAAELTVNGGASINAGHYSAGSKLDYGRSFTMGNQLTFTGSGELDNGMNVSVSFVLDQNDDSTTAGAAYSGGPFDGHSVTVSSDALGTLVFAGEGGSSATTKINTTVAGDIWDAFNGTLNSNAASGRGISEAGAGDNSFLYTAPSLMDGLDVFLSYDPQSTAEASVKSEIGYGVTYTGVEGLSVSYANADIETHASTSSGENTAIKATYAYGPVTVGYSVNEYDVGTANDDQDLTSYSVSYTVSENLSISYGYEEIEDGETTDQDSEFTKISASYTSGGVTLSASMSEAENIDGTTNANADQDYYFLGASFAF
jgi:outer membrane protein OmpU